MKNASLAGAALPLMTGTTQAATLEASTAPARKVVMPEGTGGDLKFSEDEYTRRHAAIRKAMQEQGIAALIVTGTREWHMGDLGNLLYIGSPIDWEQTFALFPLDGDPLVFQKKVQFPFFVKRGIPGLPIGSLGDSSATFKPVWAEGRPGTRISGFYGPALVKQLKAKGLAKAKIGVVSMRNLPADVYAQLTSDLPQAQFVDAQPILMALRYYKSSEEQKFVRRSAHIADRGMAATISAAKAGAHDLDLFYAADKACAEAGGPVGGFQLMGSGPWGKKHSNVLLEQGSGRTLRSGDMVIPEIGSNYRGYFTQLTVPISVGEPGVEYLKAQEMCDKVYAELINVFVPGKKVREVDAHCAAFTENLTDGEYTTLFGIQAGEHELTFWHDDYELKPGAVAYLQPFFIPAKRKGGPFHVYGDAWMVTKDKPVKLHQSKMEVVTV
ncbi:MAG: hypothetical protein Pars2KO_05510 [Parasphingorhabdus sp.]